MDEPGLKLACQGRLLLLSWPRELRYLPSFGCGSDCVVREGLGSAEMGWTPPPFRRVAPSVG